LRAVDVAGRLTMNTITRSRPAISTRIVAELGDVAHDWDRLVDWAPVPSPFLRSWWLAAAAPAARARYLLVLDAQTLIGGVALQEQRHVLGVRVYGACTGGTLCPDHVDLLAAPGRELDVCRAFDGWLARPGARLLDLDGVVQHSLLSACVPAAATRVVDVAPWDALPDTGDEYVASRSANLRRSYRRAQARLTAMGAAHHRLTPAELSGGMDEFERLHRARADRAALVDELPRLRAALVAGAAVGEVQVDVLRCASRTLASLICFRTAGALRAYQLARVLEPELPDVGTALLFQAIERACGEGCYEVDLLRGAEPYKFRFVDRRREIYRIEVARGVRARWLLAALRLLRRANAALPGRWRARS
jgi:CelD/BcsL family acetyltransferase involved in cellulose biosynthesis